jgi:hypothetical protein
MVDRSQLPNSLTITDEDDLPPGEYLIVVSEQPSLALTSDVKFSGDYCLTLDTSEGGSVTLEPTDSVEQEGAPAPTAGPGSRATRNKAAPPLRSYRRIQRQAR